MNKIVGFITSPLGALIGKILMGATVLAIIYAAVANYNESIRQNERAKNKTSQLEQVIKDKQELEAKVEELEKLNDEIWTQTQNANGKVTERHTEVTRYIQSPEAQSSNRTSSNVIKNTVRMLRDE